jgi:SAM-dependent methyltransferase
VALADGADAVSRSAVAIPGSGSVAPGACPLCGAGDPVAIWTGRDTDQLLDRRFTLWRCRSCGAGRVWPLPSDAEVAQLYPDRFYGRPAAAQGRPGLLARLVALFEALGDRQRQRWIGPPSGGGRLLDVGCGSGRFLATAEAIGWKAEGVEISGSAARSARDRCGATVHLGRVDRLELPGGAYAAVTFWHSLEHMEDQREAIRAAARVLAPGGRLIVAVPDFGSVEARLFGPRWALFDVPRHVVFFTRRTLVRLVEDAGLAVERVAHTSIEFDFPIAIQNVLNLVCTERMFLYNLAKRGAGPEACLDPGRWRYNLLASALGAIVMGPPAMALSLLLGAAGRGTTLTLAATRRPPCPV